PRHERRDGVVSLTGGACHQQCRSAADNLVGDRGDLGRRLAETKDHLREALPYRAMMVNSRESKVRIRLSAQRLDQLLERRGGFDLALRDSREQILQQFV